MKLPLHLRINGESYALEVEPRRTLADALRKDCALSGTHIGCEHGVCGSCTVIVDGEAVRSCLMFAVQADGCSVVTVEGLPLLSPIPEPGQDPVSAQCKGGDPAVVEVGRTTQDGDGVHPLQEAFMRHHGLQCGFCTPGFLTLAAAAIYRDPRISDEDLVEVLSSNLCRCTGYQGIIDAVLAAACAMRESNNEE